MTVGQDSAWNKKPLRLWVPFNFVLRQGLFHYMDGTVFVSYQQSFVRHTQTLLILNHFFKLISAPLHKGS